METLRRLVHTVGGAALALLLLTPLVTAAVAAMVTPMLVDADQRATARFPLALVTGRHASYEVATYGADFREALTSEEAVRAAAGASGLPATAVESGVTSVRSGDATYAVVHFTGPSAQQAEDALRAVSATALTALAADARSRAEVELRAALAQRESALYAMADPAQVPDLRGVPEEFRELSLEIISNQASAGVTAAQSELVLTQTVASSVSDLVAMQPVTVEELSTSADQVRLVVAAAASSFVVALLALAVLRRVVPGRVVRSQRSGDALDGVELVEASPR